MISYNFKDNKAHRHEMKKSGLYVNIDYRMSGLGSHSCGPKIADKYSIKGKNQFFF